MVAARLPTRDTVLSTDRQLLLSSTANLLQLGLVEEPHLQPLPPRLLLHQLLRRPQGLALSRRDMVNAVALDGLALQFVQAHILVKFRVNGTLSACNQRDQELK